MDLRPSIEKFSKRLTEVEASLSDPNVFANTEKDSIEAAIGSGNLADDVANPLCLPGNLIARYQVEGDK